MKKVTTVDFQKVPKKSALKIVTNFRAIEFKKLSKSIMVNQIVRMSGLKTVD